jgi:DinB superfamily
MPRWRWVERTFNFDYPVTKFFDLLERVRGTPARLEERVRGLPADVLTRREATGWSIQENIGHLIDLGYLPLQRLEEILAGKAVLCSADMTNRRTNEAQHNAAEIGALLGAFRTERAKLVNRFEELDESDWGKSALHPRLQQPMRIVDIAYFDAEHDDYHLARIGELIRRFASPTRGR